MSQSRSNERVDRPDSSAGHLSGNSAPLVIVSEQGRHSDESRRIVRAQAARASAAQSRVTRARNREGRESGSRDGLQSPTSEGPPSISPSSGESSRQSYLGAITQPLRNPLTAAFGSASDPPSGEASQQPQLATQIHRRPSQSHPHDIHTPPPTDFAGNPLGTPLNAIIEKPLVHWLASILNTSATQLFTNPYAIPAIAGYTLSGATQFLTSTGSFTGSAVSSLAGSMQNTGGAFGRIFSATGSTANDSGAPPGQLQLPRALPRGFNVLNQRIPLPESLLGLLTRTSCFDFGSPGVEERVHGLLFDLIIGYLKAALSPLAPSGPPVQDHLRIACTCLTIFQGQRANGQIFANEPQYDKGLEAAWSEVRLLDPQVLSDSRSAEANLWAVFIIAATTGTRDGSGVSFFQRVLVGLFEDLQLQAWADVRRILLDFIYPVSFLDEPCRAFWEEVQQGPGGGGQVAAVAA